VSPALTNLEFARPGARIGEAEGWTLTAFTAATSLAGFGAQPISVEDFEREWLDNELFTRAPSLTPCVFGPSPSTVERFSRGFFGNEDFAWRLSSASSAHFENGSPGEPDGFGRWLLDAPYLWALSADDIDAVAEEPFGTAWMRGGRFQRSLAEGSTKPAMFELKRAEGFEGDWPEVRSTTF
jgi:hypothetical protein